MMRRQSTDGLSAGLFDTVPPLADASPSSVGWAYIKLLLVALALIWLVCDAILLTPAFGGMDIYFFKDPGANFAQGLGFVSRFTYGNPTFQYHTYSQYPPVYPFLYGIFASIFGVTLRSNQLFNSIVNLGCGLVGFAAMWPLLKDLGSDRPWRKLAPFIQAAIFVAAIVMGFFKPEPDRPDGLAVIIGGIALLLIRARPAEGRMAVSCALCVLTFFISPFVAIWSTIALLIVAAAAVLPRERGLILAIRLAISGVIGAAIMAAIALLLIALLIPDWFGGFSGVVTGAATHNETGGGYFMLLLHGDVRGWAGAFREFTRNGAGTLYVNLARLGLVQIALAVAAIWDWWQSRATGARWQGLAIVGLLLVSPLCLIITPYQFNYIRITAALVLMAAACVATTVRRPAALAYTVAIVVGFAGIVISAAPKAFQELAGRAVSGPSLGRAVAYIRGHDLAATEQGRIVVVTSSTYMLWRQEGVRPLAIIFSGFGDAQARRRIDSLALGYARSIDPLRPEIPEWYSDTEFAQTYAPSLPQTHRLAGLPIGSGSITWESAIFTPRHLQATGHEVRHD